MDALSITTAVASLIFSSAKVVQNLCKVKDRWSRSGRTFQNICDNCSIIRGALCYLEILVTDNPSSWSSPSFPLELFDTALLSLVLTLSDLEEETTKIAGRLTSTGALRKRGKFRLNWNDQRLNDLERQIYQQQTSITFFISLLGIHSPADVRNTLDEHTALLHQIISIKEKQQASRPNSPGSRVRSLCDAEGIESLFSFRYSPSPPADEPTTIPYAVNTQGHTHASAYYDGSESAVTEDGQNPYADNLPSGYTTSEDHGVEQRFVTVTKHNEIVVQWERAYQELQSRIGRLETELGRARGYANGWVSAYKRLRAENANNVSRLEKIDKDNKALGQSNNDLHNRLGDNKQVIKSLQNEIIELEQGRNSLKEENRILSSRNYELRIESVQTTNTYERELTLLGGSCNEWWRESDILWRKYRRSQRIRAQHENQLERMDQQLGDLLCRNEELRQRPTVVQSVINLNLQHVKQVQAGLHEHDAKLDQMLSNVQYLASNEHLMKKLRSNAEGLLKQHGVQLNSALSQPSRHQQRRSTVPLDDGSKTQHSYQDDVSRSREEPGLEFSKSITSKPPTNTKLRASSQAREPTSTAAGRLPVVRPVQLDNHINGADLGESTMLRGSHHGDATLQPSIQQATQQQRRARPQSSRHKRHRAESDLPHRDAHLETEPRSCLWWFAGQRKPRRS